MIVTNWLDCWYGICFMKKSIFALNFNKAARLVMFKDEQTALRIQIEGNDIAFKSVMRVGTYQDAIPVDVTGTAGIPARITGTMAPVLAKLLTRQGFTAKLPLFALSKGKGGWYYLRHLDIDKMPLKAATVKVDLPENMEDVISAPVKRKYTRRTPVVAKTKNGAKPAKFGKKQGSAKVVPMMTPGEDAHQMLAAYERIIIGAGIAVANASAVKRVGRPRAELADAQDILVRFETLVHRIMGSTHLSEAVNKIMKGNELVAEGLALIGDLSARQENLMTLAQNLAETHRLGDTAETGQSDADMHTEDTDIATEQADMGDAAHQDQPSAVEPSEPITDPVHGEVVDEAPASHDKPAEAPEITTDVPVETSATEIHEAPKEAPAPTVAEEHKVAPARSKKPTRRVTIEPEAA